MTTAIILSGGTGTRMGLDIPKQYVLVNDVPILHYSLKTFLENGRINKIVICCAPDWKNYVEQYLNHLVREKEIIYSLPGETRQLTIYNALKMLQETSSDDEIVIIHDGARPLVTHDLINRCLDGCKDYDAVLPVIRMKDTIYLSEDGHQIKSLIDRNHLFAGQAPEAFRYRKYLEIHESMPREELFQINGSTEIAYKCGLNVTMVSGDEMNFKITTPEDLESFKTIINEKLQ